MLNSKHTVYIAEYLLRQTSCFFLNSTPQLMYSVSKIQDTRLLVMILANADRFPLVFNGQIPKETVWPFGRHFHLTSTTLLHYLMNFQNSK